MAITDFQIFSFLCSPPRSASVMAVLYRDAAGFAARFAYLGTLFSAFIGGKESARAY